MISSPNRADQGFGGAPWHEKERIVLFRDGGDGRCYVYICPIEPLFKLRTIGHHSVQWNDVKQAAMRTAVFDSEKALSIAP
jgi:hypothetical protein